MQNCKTRWFDSTVFSPVLVAVGTFAIFAPLAVRAESNGDTFVQLLVPGPNGTRLPVRMHEGMILPSGSITPTPLFAIQRQILGITDGSTTVFQGVLDHPASPGTLAVTDGVHQWTQQGGSNHPNFAVTYSTSTRNTFVLYPESAPEAGREIVASYSNDALLPINGGHDFRLQTVRGAAHVSPLVYSAGTPVADGGRLDLEISGDLLNWVRVPLSPPLLTENGSLRLTDHVFTQRKSIMETDGVNQVFLGRNPEPIVAGTLSITDGIYTWSQTEGSSAPDDFSVTYASATRSLVATYPTSVPDAGRLIRATYDVEVRHALAAFLRLNFDPEEHPYNNHNLVWINGGELNMSMGVRTVKTFQIGRYEVTWGEWKAVRSEATARGFDIGNVGDGCGDDHPVHSVNWYDALKWCNLKSEIEGLNPVYMYDGGIFKTGQGNPSWNTEADGYRLPDDAEWEFAARGGNKTNGFTYSGSNLIDPVGWYWNNSTGSLCNLSNERGSYPIGTKLPNELGLYDMSGNVSEYLWNFFPGNPNFKVVGGGSWNDNSSSCEVSLSLFTVPTSRHFDHGLRVARGARN